PSHPQFFTRKVWWPLRLEDSPMIVRVQKHQHHYVIIDNRPLRDERLTWKARGLLAYLLSCPDDWKVNSRHLASISTDGPKVVLSGLKELEAAGYAHLETGGQNGGRQWVIYETPDL